MTDFSATRLRCDFREVVDLTQDSIGFVNDSPARVRKSDLLLVSVEKLYSEFLLQLADLLTQRRLADVEAYGGAAEVQFFSYRHEVTQMPEVHDSSEFCNVGDAR
jgi:hypothetical protein